MANHKSAEKANRQAEKRTLINKSRVSRIKTSIRNAKEALAAPQKTEEELRVCVVNAEREIMRGVRKGVLHRNTAARRVSKLALKLNAVTKV